MDDAVVRHKSYKRVEVSVLFSNEVAFTKPVIGSHSEKRSPKYVRYIATYVKHN